MEDSNKKEFAAMMYAFGDVYGVEFSKVVLGLWFDALLEYDILQIAEAIRRYMRNPDDTYGKPKPNDLIRLIVGTSSDTSSLAWSKFDKALRMVGVYESVCFDDPIIHQVIRDMGGWISFGDKKEQEWPFLARDFKERYKAYKIKKDEHGGSGALMGISTADNLLLGFKVSPPVLIGDTEKATAVLEMKSGEQFKISTGVEQLKIESIG